MLDEQYTLIIVVVAETARNIVVRVAAWQRTTACRVRTGAATAVHTVSTHRRRPIFLWPSEQRV